MAAKYKRIKKASLGRNIFSSILLGALFLLVIGFLVVTNLKISQKRANLTSRIEELREEIQALEEKNEELKNNISQAQSKEYLEKIAREELGLKKPGEEVVVIKNEEEEKAAEEEKGDWWNPRTWWQWLKNKARD